jgi:glucose/arabinose dehydrogenase
MLSGRARLLASAAVVVTLVGVVLVVTDGDGEDASRVVTEVDDDTTTTRDRSSTSSASSTASSSTTTSSTAAPTTSAAPATTLAPPTTSAPPPPPPPDPFASTRIRLTRVVSLDYPIAVAVRPGDGSLWVARKGGTVCRLTGGSCTASQVVASVSSGNEQGLLGIAFSPAGSRFYASYTNPAGDTRLDEFPVRADGTADVAQRRNIFAEDQPAGNHNGGNIVFGPDGRLYLGLGDGGGQGDPNGNAQNPSTDLGKILRIDPAGPTVERWISGVRNPWRFSFDRANGDLWVADVGQGSWEEVSRLPAGAQRGRNLGWRCYEGTHPYSGCAPAGGHAGPLFEYPHGPGCSVTGGYVYRGSRIPALVGAYLYSDYCDGQIRGLTVQGGRVRTSRGLAVNPGNVVSFGQAGNGDLFVLTPGAIFRIDAA